VPEEEAMVGPGVVASLVAQEKAKLTAWQQAFSRIPHQSFLQSVQGEPTTGVTLHGGHLPELHNVLQQGVSCEFDGL